MKKRMINNVPPSISESRDCIKPNKWRYNKKLIIENNFGKIPNIKKTEDATIVSCIIEMASGLGKGINS